MASMKRGSVVQEGGAQSLAPGVEYSHDQREGWFHPCHLRHRARRNQPFRQRLPKNLEKWRLPPPSGPPP